VRTEGGGRKEGCGAGKRGSGAGQGKLIAGRAPSDLALLSSPSSTLLASYSLFPSSLSFGICHRQAPSNYEPARRRAGVSGRAARLMVSDVSDVASNLMW